MRQTDPFLSVVDAYALPAAVRDTTVSRRVFGDSQKIGAMRRGADLTLTRCANALQWFSDNWPDGAVWPENVARPEQTQEDAA
jgi:hypothetical protein